MLWFTVWSTSTRQVSVPESAEQLSTIGKLLGSTNGSKDFSKVSMQDLEKALKIVREHAHDCHFAGRRSPEVVACAEKALGLTFPPTYRRFVVELGAGGLGSAEFYGVIDQDFEDSAVPDGIWLTLDERAHSQLPNNLIVFAETGDGGWLALDASKKSADGEFPVVVWAAPKPEGPPVQEIASDFGNFFLEGVQRAVNRIERT